MTKLLLSFFVTLLCAGCIGGRSRADAGGVSAEQTLEAENPVLDSIVCTDACAEYTCYFVPRTRNKRALEHIRAVLLESSLCEPDFERYSDTLCADRYRRHLLDSMEALEWLDFEPWIAVRQLYLDWTQQQLERAYILYRSSRDASYLYRCSESDSVLTRGADMLNGSSETFVEEVRRFWRAAERAKAAGLEADFGEDYLRYTLTYIDTVLDVPDSTSEARERLFILLSNHINAKIHDRLGKDGAVNFYEYTTDFLDVFDSVKIETWEP